MKTSGCIRLSFWIKYSGSPDIKQIQEYHNSCIQGNELFPISEKPGEKFENMEKIYQPNQEDRKKKIKSKKNV
ncbi:hypothetical protein [Desulfospira joergensenii]|uniref:hypothetical protein n=1 Tax=Desulfospira joergensenii TaxID=53329 RepID=UPI0012946A1B|nr:hypothetical protein [Desulfospira joergensenii]